MYHDSILDQLEVLKANRAAIETGKADLLDLAEDDWVFVYTVGQNHDRPIHLARVDSAKGDTIEVGGGRFDRFTGVRRNLSQFSKKSAVILPPRGDYFMGGNVAGAESLLTSLREEHERNNLAHSLQGRLDEILLSARTPEFLNALKALLDMDDAVKAARR